MRIGIYDPYLDTLGGGERYILTAASCLSQKHIVDVFWSESKILPDASQKFSIDLSQVKIVPNIFSKDTSFTSRLLKTRQYDRIIFLSDGSIPWLFAKKNIILFQFPVSWVKGRSITNRLKLKNIYKTICYTEFVKQYLDKTFDTDTKILYPPVETFGKSDNKEKIILSVGRFTKSMNSKKQEVLIDVFKKIYKNGFKDWRLVLIGSYLPVDKDFVDDIKEKAKGYPIEVHTNASFKDLKNYYQKAKIYWHATGYGEDLQQYPERAEHFGISTVEAMSAGAVPVVINAGGQKEIVTTGVDGYLWNTLDELAVKTKILINDQKEWEKVSRNAIKRSEDFSYEHFCERLRDILK
jgi:glycosyltransferase involved in cell wall biosynthesis